MAVTPSNTPPSKGSPLGENIYIFDNAPFTSANAGRMHAVTGSMAYKPNVGLYTVKGFNPNKPAVMVLFYHGHKATLEDDVIGHKDPKGRYIPGRQRLIEQLEKSGVNAVLVAPQLMHKYANSYAGNLEKPPGVQRLLDEAAQKLGQITGAKADVFKNMPLIVSGYSGGGRPTAYTLQEAMKNPKLMDRITGVQMNDAMYGRENIFLEFFKKSKAFLNSTYIGNGMTARSNTNLQAGIDEAIRNGELPKSAKNRISIKPAPTDNHTQLIEGMKSVAGAITSLLAQVKGFNLTPPTTAVAAVPPPPPAASPARPAAAPKPASPTTAAPPVQPAKEPPQTMEQQSDAWEKNSPYANRVKQLYEKRIKNREALLKQPAGPQGTAHTPRAAPTTATPTTVAPQPGPVTKLDRPVLHISVPRAVAKPAPPSK